MSPSSSSERLPFGNSRFISVEGTTIHSRVWQPEARVSSGTALLIHGFGASTFSWRFIGPGLASLGYYTVAVDLPGFGYSSRETAEAMNDSSWTRLMWLIANVIETDASVATEEFTSGESKRWVLVGHSLGGRIVAGMAAQHPERVRRTVFVDAALYGPPAALPMLGVAPVRWLLGRWLENEVLTKRGVARLLQSAYGRAPSSSEVTGYLDPLLEPGTIPVLLRLARSMPEVSAADLARIEGPALVVWGEQDTWIAVRFALRIFNDLPNSEIFVVPEAAHLSIETHPQEVLERLGEFL